MKKHTRNMRYLGKAIIGFVLVAVMLFSLCACSDIVDQATNVAQSLDSHVLAVKGGTPNAWPDKTYGEAFENFFGSPTWEYFVGTKEGPDEDGDGKPDYTEENVDIVEFTGYCTYKETEVKALIQFTLSKEDDTFEATYLSFNDVPQNNFMLLALLEAVFTDEDLESVEEKSEAGDSSKTNATPHSPTEFIGKWWDVRSQRCNMNIELSGNVYYIDIKWSSGASESTHWSLEGSYDNAKGGILYHGSKTETYYTEQGDEHKTASYSDGEGLIWIDDSGALYWDDYKEQSGARCVFEKDSEEDIYFEDASSVPLFPSDIIYITEDDLKFMSKDDVAFIRNEIYARHGYIFQSEPYKSYFETIPWYCPNPNFSEALFNDIERANKDFIVNYEQKMGWR